MCDFQPFPLPINTNQTIGCCVIKNCPSNTISNLKISWHSFPHDEEIRQKWLEFVGNGESLSSSSTLCSCHFAEECFEKDLLAELIDGEISKRLIEGSIPTIKGVPIKKEVKQCHKKDNWINNHIEIKNPKICCVPHCRSNIFIENNEFVKTFPFPRTKYRQEKWFKALDLKPQRLWRPHICINHFEIKYLVRSIVNNKPDNISDEIKLHSDAIPTLLLDNSKIQPYCKTLKTHYNIPNAQTNAEDKSKLTNKSHSNIYIPKSGNFCRICLTENIRLIPMAFKNDRKFLSLDILPAGKLFEKIIGVKIEALPFWFKICFICYNKIESIYEFQKNAQTIHQNLIQIQKYPNLIENIFNSIKKSDNRQRKLTNIESNAQINVSESENLENSEDYFFLDDSDYSESSYDSNDDDTGLNIEQTISDQENEIKENYPKVEDVRKYFQCKLKTCNKIFLSEINYNDHISRHHKIKCYNCKICNKWFYEMLEYQIHQKQYHSTNGVNYKCPKCTKIFTNIYKLSAHCKVHDTPEYCTICGKNIDNMRKHLKFHNIEKVLQCWICLKMFTNTLSFKSHLNYEHSKRTYACTYRKCTKKFKWKIHLEKHMHSHKNQENTYYCGVCHKLVYNKVDKHIERHKTQSKTNDVRNECKICGEIFINLKTYKDHILKNHNNRKYKCTVPNCSLQFIRKGHFENHMRAHSNPKNEKVLETLHNRFLMKLKMEKELYGNSPYKHKIEQQLSENDSIDLPDKNKKNFKSKDNCFWNSIDDDEDENLKILLNDDQDRNDCSTTIRLNEEHQNNIESQENLMSINFQAHFEKCPQSVVFKDVKRKTIYNYAEEEMEFENFY